MEKTLALTTTFLQLYDLVLVFAFFAVTKFIFQANSDPKDLGIISLNLDQGFVLLGVYLICLSIFDLIYMPWFYKNGKSIIANMLVAVLAIMVVGGILTIVPYIFFKDILSIKGGNIILQLGFLLASIGIWIGSKVLVIKKSTKNLVKLDF